MNAWRVTNDFVVGKPSTREELESTSLIMDWRSTRNKKWIRLIALLVVFAFINQDIVWAQGGDPIWGKQAASANPLNINSNINVPKDVAVTKEVYNSTGDKTIINIQDAHASLAAQESIASILDSLVTNYDLKLIAIEGSTGYIDTSLLKTFPDENIKRSTAKYLMGKGRMSAGEFFAITSNKPIALYGIEDKPLYETNVEQFRKVYEINEATKTDLANLKAALKELQEKIYSSDLKELDANSVLHKDGKITFTARWELVNKLAGKTGSSYEKYPNLSKLVESLKLEKGISFDTANKERDSLIDALSKSLAKAELEKLVLKSLAFKTNKVSQGEYYTFLEDLAQKNGISPAPYKNLINYTEYIALYEAIDLLGIFAEARDFEDEIKAKLFANDDQKKLHDLSKCVDFIQDLFELKLQNGDFEYLSDNVKVCNAQVLAEFLRDASSKYNVALKGDYDIGRIFGYIPAAMDFYHTAEKRNSVMFANTVSRMNQEGQNVAALITGGYHTKGLTELLRQKETSYLVILPKFDASKPERPYVAILTNKAESYKGLLQSGQYYLATAAYFNGISGMISRDLADQAKLFAELNENYGQAIIQAAKFYVSRESDPEKAESRFKRMTVAQLAKDCKSLLEIYSNSYDAFYKSFTAPEGVRLLTPEEFKGFVKYLFNKNLGIDIDKAAVPEGVTAVSIEPGAIKSAVDVYFKEQWEKTLNQLIADDAAVERIFKAAQSGNGPVSQAQVLNVLRRSEGLNIPTSTYNKEASIKGLVDALTLKVTEKQGAPAKEAAPQKAAPAKMPEMLAAQIIELFDRIRDHIGTRDEDIENLIAEARIINAVYKDLPPDTRISIATKVMRERGSQAPVADNPVSKEKRVYSARDWILYLVVSGHVGILANITKDGLIQRNKRAFWEGVYECHALKNDIESRENEPGSGAGVLIERATEMWSLAAYGGEITAEDIRKLTEDLHKYLGKAPVQAPVTAAPTPKAVSQERPVKPQAAPAEVKKPTALYTHWSTVLLAILITILAAVAPSMAAQTAAQTFMRTPAAIPQRAVTTQVTPTAPAAPYNRGIPFHPNVDTKADGDTRFSQLIPLAAAAAFITEPLTNLVPTDPKSAKANMNRNEFIVMLCILEHESMGGRRRTQLEAGAGTGLGQIQVWKDPRYNNFRDFLDRLSRRNDGGVLKTNIETTIRFVHDNYFPKGPATIKELKDASIDVQKAYLVLCDAFAVYMTRVALALDPDPMPDAGSCTNALQLRDKIAEYWFNVYNRDGSLARADRREATLKKALAEDVPFNLSRYSRDMEMYRGKTGSKYRSLYNNAVKLHREWTNKKATLEKQLAGIPDERKRALLEKEGKIEGMKRAIDRVFTRLAAMQNQAGSNLKLTGSVQNFMVTTAGISVVEKPSAPKVQKESVVNAVQKAVTETKGPAWKKIATGAIIVFLAVMDIILATLWLRARAKRNISGTNRGRLLSIGGILLLGTALSSYAGEAARGIAQDSAGGVGIGTGLVLVGAAIGIVLGARWCLKIFKKAPSLKKPVPKKLADIIKPEEVTGPIYKMNSVQLEAKIASLGIGFNEAQKAMKNFDPEKNPAPYLMLKKITSEIGDLRKNPNWKQFENEVAKLEKAVRMRAGKGVTLEMQRYRDSKPFFRDNRAGRWLFDNVIAPVFESFIFPVVLGLGSGTLLANIMGLDMTSGAASAIVAVTMTAAILIFVHRHISLGKIRSSISPRAPPGLRKEVIEKTVVPILVSLPSAIFLIGTFFAPQILTHILGQTPQSVFLMFFLINSGWHILSNWLIQPLMNKLSAIFGWGIKFEKGVTGTEAPPAAPAPAIMTDEEFLANPIYTDEMRSALKVELEYLRGENITPDYEKLKVQAAAAPELVKGKMYQMLMGFGKTLTLRVPKARASWLQRRATTWQRGTLELPDRLKASLAAP
ncbi:MAG: hypothetical protein NTZ95_01910 [Candidatus Omnitrophica bacterium]|nr:hypothetical protein [Candidatus Omnitrophota bacterium]